MIYLNEQDINELGIDWETCTNTIHETVMCLYNKDTAQPVKPYLRFKNLLNRIIAMPAYVGGIFDVAGIKWIASFPSNIEKKISRASSVIILNDSNTGQVLSIVNTNLISIIRTVSVSSLMMRHFFNVRDIKNLTIGIIGFGPIGQYHYKMCMDLYGDRISKFVIFDIRKINPDIFQSNINIKIVTDWVKAYTESDVVITCTVSREAYIDKKPKVGSLLLNVSLRDYKPEVYKFVKNAIIVDDWDEVCREKTDIEIFHNEKGLREGSTKSIVDVVVSNCIEIYPKNQSVMFNPMGMAIFDVAIAKQYLTTAIDRKIGLDLE